MDIDAKQDRRRYVECIDCGHPYGFDRQTNKCTIVSCGNYFGTPTPRPPSTREVVAAERAVLAAAKVWLKSGAYSAQLAAAVAALVDLDP